MGLLFGLREPHVAQVIYLQDYLRTFKNICLIVSHDRGFLNNVCTDVVLLNGKKLTYYKASAESVSPAPALPRLGGEICLGCRVPGSLCWQEPQNTSIALSSRLEANGKASCSLAARLGYLTFFCVVRSWLQPGGLRDIREHSERDSSCATASIRCAAEGDFTHLGVHQQARRAAQDRGAKGECLKSMLSPPNSYIGFLSAGTWLWVKNGYPKWFALVNGNRL